MTETDSRSAISANPILELEEVNTRLSRVDRDLMILDAHIQEQLLRRDLLVDQQQWLRVLAQRLGGTVTGLPAPARVATSPAPAKGQRRARKGPTHKDMILAVLGEAESSLGVAELVAAISRKFGVSVQRTSISPLLRKMHDQGLVVHDRENEKWSAKPSTGNTN